MVEQNPLSAVQNNVIATANIFRLVGENQVPKVIFISSYEAYEPKNVFGYTKKAAELLMALYAKKYTKMIWRRQESKLSFWTYVLLMV
jgi:FlaA1/EpsC-like NDP-sugar epimerase